MSIVLISGSGFYDFQTELTASRQIELETAYGQVIFQQGSFAGQQVYCLARHGVGHTHLSHQINHLAHFSACQQVGASAIIGLSIVGVVNSLLPLAELMLPADLYYPDNRLPTGAVCSLFDQAGRPGRGHLIMAQHFHQGLIQQMQVAADALDVPIHGDLNYAYVQGPRFNSRSEIRALAGHKIDIISQTLGPEAVLAGELEIPYAALCFGVDYANGVQAQATPIETLATNMKASKAAFTALLKQTLANWQAPVFDGFVYRFE